MKISFRKLKKKYEIYNKNKELEKIGNTIQSILNCLSHMPVIIVSYRNYVYVENTVKQLNRFNIIPIIIDNYSNDAENINKLNILHSEKKAYVIFSKINFGHKVGFFDPIYKVLPNNFAYTDPDLQFSSNLPENFLEILANLAEKYNTYKAGFALSLLPKNELSNSPIKINQIELFKFEKNFSIFEWESRHWRFLIDPVNEIYAAPIDTTFAVYNKMNYKEDFLEAVRVAGDFLSIHLPWFPKKDLFTPTDKINYKVNNKSSTWIFFDKN